MTGVESNNDMLTNRKSFGGGDIETGISSGHLSNIERTDIPFKEPLEKIRDGVNNHGLVEDIDKWAGSLTRLLEDVPQYMSNTGHPGRISKIPENLREADIKAYEPYILAIGPYHHGKPRMKRMEMTKQIILKCVLEQKPEITLKDYLMELKNIEPQARGFYQGIEMESEKFVHMLLLDSMFILLKFCGTPVGRERTKKTDTGAKEVRVGNHQNMEIMANSPELDKETSNAENSAVPPAWWWPLFVHDIFLIENQLPFFVLRKIHSLAYGNSKTQLVDILKYHIGHMLWDYTKVDPGMIISSSEDVHHLLHLCHTFFRPTVQQEPITFEHTESSQIFRLGSAVQLYEAGVSFEPRSSSTYHTLLDITFDKSGIMVLPCLNVDDNTNSLLRNLIALEQMKYPLMGLDVSSYVVLLLHLITTPEDAKLLRRKGIIEHHLASDKEMMCLINRLSVGLAFDYLEDRYGLKPVFQELKKYTERRVPQWRAWLKHRYFYNPWTIITLVAASLLLLLSALQTFYQVYSYYR